MATCRQFAHLRTAIRAVIARPLFEVTFDGVETQLGLS